MNTYTRPADKAAQEAERKARRKQEQAAIVTGLQTVLEGDEQILAFLRGRIAGGWKGKLTIGPEAFFAPYVNVGLTDRRLILQHVHPENDRPSEILPHFFDLGDITSVTFGDIETFGGEPAGRLAIRFKDEQHIRIRLAGEENSEDARDMVEVFKSLLLSQKRAETSPTQSKCPTCNHILDQPFKFCPYCGQRIEAAAATNDQRPTTNEEQPAPEPMPVFEAAPEPLPVSEPSPVSTSPDQQPETRNQELETSQPGPAGAFGIFRAATSEAPVAPPQPSAPEPVSEFVSDAPAAPEIAGDSFPEPSAPPEIPEPETPQPPDAPQFPPPALDPWGNMAFQSEESPEPLPDTQPDTVFENNAEAELSAETSGEETPSSEPTDGEKTEEMPPADNPENQNSEPNETPPANPWQSNPWQGDL